MLIARRWDLDFYEPQRRALLHDALSRYLQNLAKQNKKAVLLAQVPFLNELQHEKWLHAFLSNTKLPSPAALLTNKADGPNNYIQQIALQNNAVFFNPLEDLPPATRESWPVYKGMTAYRDKDHLNEFVTRQWAAEVLPKQKDFWVKL